MNKTELVAAVAVNTNLSKADAARALDCALEYMTDALIKGEPVQLLGFGSFAISKRSERRGRNPSTGEGMIIKAGNMVKFTAGKSLKQSVNTTSSVELYGPAAHKTP